MVGYIKLIALFCLLVLPGAAAQAQAKKRLPILDMHMHARTADHYGPPPLAMCAPVERMPLWDAGEMLQQFPACKKPVWSPKTDEELMRQVIAVMERNNMIGMLGGKPDLVAKWVGAAPGRFIPGLDFRLDRGMSPDEVRALHKGGAFKVLGEVLNQYIGIAPDDERMEPYWTLAEELDIPVGIHIGGGEPGQAYNRSTSKFRARMQSALTLEEVLVRHPKLRVYIMHAGYPMLDDLLALMFSYPQVYVEVGTIVNVERRASFYRYLKGIVDAGYGERVMFGSDPIIWPGIIEPAIESIEQVPFLSRRQKRDIFYNNAARFLRLSKEEIARHHRLRHRPRRSRVAGVARPGGHAPPTANSRRLRRETWPRQIVRVTARDRR